MFLHVSLVGLRAVRHKSHSVGGGKISSPLYMYVIRFIESRTISSSYACCTCVVLALLSCECLFFALKCDFGYSHCSFCRVCVKLLSVDNFCMSREAIAWR